MTVIKNHYNGEYIVKERVTYIEGKGVTREIIDKKRVGNIEIHYDILANSNN